jgi:hypothetical protein
MYEAFRTIGEAASELGLKTHVLRFWETKFDNLADEARRWPALLSARRHGTVAPPAESPARAGTDHTWAP